MGFDLLRQRHPLGCRKGRCETDQIELAMCVVEPEQKRSAATLCVLAVATDHAVGGHQLLHLPHRALALMVRLVAGLGDHAVKRTTPDGQPSLGLVEPGRTEKHRVGVECCSTGRSRWTPYQQH